MQNRPVGILRDGHAGGLLLLGRQLASDHAVAFPGMVKDDGAVPSIGKILQITIKFHQRQLPGLVAVVRLADFEPGFLAVFAIREDLEVFLKLPDREDVVPFGKKEFAVIEKVILR